jgi:chromosomal replication initiator protein
MYLARKFTDQPLADIGRAFNRDHSTVVHSVRVITDAINRNGSVRGQIDLLTEKIRKQFT